MEKIALLKELLDLVDGERVSYSPYGTSNEDSFLSGINEGISKAEEQINALIEKLEAHE